MSALAARPFQGPAPWGQGPAAAGRRKSFENRATPCGGRAYLGGARETLGQKGYTMISLKAALIVASAVGAVGVGGATYASVAQPDAGLRSGDSRLPAAKAAKPAAAAHGLPSCTPSVLPKNGLPHDAKLPNGTALPTALTLPTDITLPNGATLPSAIKLPAGVKLPEGLALPNGAKLPGGKLNGKLPKATTLPAGTKLPANTVLPKGTTLPADIKLPEGAKIPAGVKLPKGAEAKLPAGVQLPNGTKVPNVPQLPNGKQLPGGKHLPNAGKHLPDGAKPPACDGAAAKGAPNAAAPAPSPAPSGVPAVPGMPAVPNAPKLSCDKLPPAVTVGGTVEKAVTLPRGLRFDSVRSVTKTVGTHRICTVTQKWTGKAGQWLTVERLKGVPRATEAQLRQAAGLAAGATKTTVGGTVAWQTPKGDGVLVLTPGGDALYLNGSPLLAGSLRDVASHLRPPA